MDDFENIESAEWKARVFVYTGFTTEFAKTINELLEDVAKHGGRLYDIETQFTPEQNYVSCIVTYELPKGASVSDYIGQDDKTEPIGFSDS